MRKDRKNIIIFSFVIYCIFILWMTILKREPNAERKIVFDLFWSFRKWLSGSKRGRRETIQYVNNILFFIPFGVLFPWKEKGWKVVLITAACFSVMIEIVQYVFMLGWCELDDVVSNALGATLGFGLYLLLSRLFGEKHKWKEF